MRRRLFLPALLALLASACGYEIPPELAARTAAQLEQARSLVADMDLQWHKAIALAEKQPFSRFGRKCAVDVVPAHSLLGDSQQLDLLLGDMKRKRYPIHMLEAAKLDDAHSPRFKMAERKLSMIDHYLRPDQDFKADEKERIEARLAEVANYTKPDFWSWDLIVLIDEEKAAQVTQDRHGLPASRVERDLSGLITTTTTPYTPGLIAGRAYLYDYRLDRVICASRFTASNSTKIRRYTRGSGLRWTLRDDLRARGLAEAIRKLRDVPKR